MHDSWLRETKEANIYLLPTIFKTFLFPQQLLPNEKFFLRKSLTGKKFLVDGKKFSNYAGETLYTAY